MGRVDEAGLIDLWEDIEQDPAFAHLRDYAANIHLVPGIGASRPLAMIVGEAPGATENARREPFCGASGQVLHQLMALAGLSAHWVGFATGVRVPPGCAEGIPPNVWLTNAIKYRPPGNRTPTVGEQIAARPYLRREWKLIGRPRLIVAVGSVAAHTIGAHPTRTQRGVLRRMQDHKTWICYQCHPAYGLRNPAIQPTMERHWEQLREDMKELQWE
jgi:uracil-DNA glycosylase